MLPKYNRNLKFDQDLGGKWKILKNFKFGQTFKKILCWVLVFIWYSYFEDMYIRCYYEIYELGVHFWRTLWNIFYCKLDCC
jgi:hypothetical protein